MTSEITSVILLVWLWLLIIRISILILWSAICNSIFRYLLRNSPSIILLVLLIPRIVSLLLLHVWSTILLLKLVLSIPSRTKVCLPTVCWLSTLIAILRLNIEFLVFALFSSFFSPFILLKIIFHWAVTWVLRLRIFIICTVCSTVSNWFIATCPP